jgi:hypothetical protein
MKLTLTLLSTLLLSVGFPSIADAKDGGYPLKVCIVTDNDLNSMGDEQVRVYNGQQIKFCCEPCVAKFEKNKARYLAKLPHK